MQNRSPIVLALLLSALASPLDGAERSTDRLAGGPSQPEAAELPKAEDLFEGYIAAIGGMENIRKHQNRVLHGIYHAVQSDDTQILTLYCEAPDHLRAELVVPALGSTVRATNGEVAWGTSSTGTAFMLSENEAADLKDSAIIHGEAAYKDRYQSVETVGTAMFDGKQAYQVDFVTKAGMSGSVYFDAESKLVVARQVKRPSETEKGTLVLVGKYQEFEGVLIPTLQQQRFDDVQTVNVEIEFRWIEVNVEELPSFDPPAQLTAGSGG